MTESAPGSSAGDGPIRAEGPESVLLTPRGPVGIDWHNASAAAARVRGGR